MVDTERQSESNESQFHSNINLILAIFVCWCCVASLLLHSPEYVEYDGAETVLEVQARQMLIQEVDKELEIKLQEYLIHIEFKDRTKRDALFETLEEEEDMVQPYVEFFNSTLRWTREREEYEEWDRRRKGTAPGGDFMVFLTNNSGIAIKVLMDFCTATQEYCPSGAQGPIGSIGCPGSLGDIGISGVPGAPGNQGSSGIPGHVGSEGYKGDLGGKGSFGIRGSFGPVGSQGVKGEIGAAGVKGTIGDPGLSGLKGPAGRKGDRRFYRRSRING